MLEALGAMALIIALGVIWARARWGDIRVDATRRVLAASVYYLFLPALVLDLFWPARFGPDSLAIAIVAACSILAGLGAGWLLAWARGASRAERGAMILAAGYSNVTYLGLPLLTAVYGATGASVAIQYDLLASTPLLFSLGVLIAAHFGSRPGPDGKLQPLATLLRVPALWALASASALTGLGVTPPGVIAAALDLLAAPVTPLMLITLGLALRLEPQALRPRLTLPVSAITLVLVPALALVLSRQLIDDPIAQVGTVLEAAMPSMVFGVVLCERYGLDASLYANIVTVTTLLSLATLPLWQAIATAP